MERLKDTELYKKITSKENIFTAIYSLESYVFEKYLLDNDDIFLLNALKDKYNEGIIEQTILECQKILEDILCNKDSLFEATVFFKFKKMDTENGDATVKTRPIHVADLRTQICIVCMLNLLMYEDSHTKGRRLSEISNLLPSYFYGNIPSTNLEHLFIPWIKQYKRYTQNIIESFHNYRENKKYKYEVTLDLQNFFPSINPNIIYNLIKNSFAHLYEGNSELNCLEQVLIKLLYFKLNINPLDYKEYYGKVVKKELYDKFIEKAQFYTIGIPQGLPQSYFFGNLCMTRVESCIKKEIDGEAFYYVDDSTIFSNTDFSDSNKFKKCIKRINSSLVEYCKNNEGTPYKPCKDFNTYLNYQIHIHEDGKSTFDNINEKEDEWSGMFFLAKQASTISHDLFSSIDDSDDFTLKEKVYALLDEIDKEITRLKELPPEMLSANKLKILVRYKKFYTFRLRLLDLHNTSGEELYQEKTKGANELNDDTTRINDYKTRYKPMLKSKKPQELSITKELLEEGIFWTETLFLIKNLKGSKEKQNEIALQLNSFEKKLFKNKIYALYYKKTASSLMYELSLINNKYKSLSEKMHLNFTDYRSVNTNFIKDELVKFTSNYIWDNSETDSFFAILEKINKVLDVKKYKGRSSNYCKNQQNNGYYNSFVFRYSNSYQRKIYNALFSNLLSVPIADEDNIIKINGQCIRYFELRILVSLRNNEFDSKIFRLKIFDILNSIYIDGYQKIDFSLLEVLPIFRKNVANPEDIDRLILLHKYVNSLWKNGSKFLYFYTLHNEEHSVELIKLTTKLIKAINFLTIKKSDYFILFAACYLHDISMVIYPDVYQFIPDKEQSELIYTEFKDKIKSIRDYSDSRIKNDIKKFIVENYRDVNDFFENKIRNNHAKTSAHFITRKNKEMDQILINSEKQYIANISESHGYDTSDIYSMRSKAKTDTINLKYLMILLRLADLMDMVKDRVSINIMKQNIKHMPQESKFHWISHLVTDRCEIKSTFYHNPDKVGKFCQKGSVIEEFIVELSLNMKRLQNVKPTNCDHISCKINKEKQELVIDIHENSHNPKKEDCTACFFLCKWMKVKNHYLFNELYDLQRYLNRNTNNLFKSKMKVILKYEDSSSLPAEYIDIVREKIL